MFPQKIIAVSTTATTAIRTTVCNAEEFSATLIKRTQNLVVIYWGEKENLFKWLSPGRRAGGQAGRLAHTSARRAGRKTKKIAGRQSNEPETFHRYLFSRVASRVGSAGFGAHYLNVKQAIGFWWSAATSSSLLGSFPAGFNHALHGNCNGTIRICS